MKDLIRKILKEDFNPNILQQEYDILSNEISSIEKTIETLKDRLPDLRLKSKKLKSIVEPHITITEVDTPTMGNRYMGKSRIYIDDSGRGKVITFTMGKVDQFDGIDDPRLYDVGKSQIIRYIDKYHPELLHSNF